MELVISRGFESNSASPTDIWKGKYKGNDCIVKIYVKQYIKKTVGLQIPRSCVMLEKESDIYEFLRDRLILDELYQGRNIVRLYKKGTANFKQCYELLSNSLRFDKWKILKNLSYNTLYMLGYHSGRHSISDKTTESDVPVPEMKKWLRRDLIKTSDIEYGYMITQAVEGDTFADFVARKVRDPGTLSAYMFVILTALFAMNAVGVNQNDLHWGNILMSETTMITPMDCKTYFIANDEVLYLVQNKYTPFIYDFDRGVKSGTKANYLKQYERGGNCPDYNSKRDLLKMLCCAYHACKHIGIEAFGENMINSLVHPNVQDEIRRTNTSCWLTTETSSVLCDEKSLEFGVTDWNGAFMFFIKEAVKAGKLKSTATEDKVFDSMIRYASAARDEKGLTTEQYLSRNLQFLGSEEKRSILYNRIFKRMGP